MNQTLTDIRPTTWKFALHCSFFGKQEAQGRYIDCALEALKTSGADIRKVYLAQFWDLDKAVWVPLTQAQINEAIDRVKGWDS